MRDSEWKRWWGLICVNETQPKSTRNTLCCGQQKSYTSSSPLHPTPFWKEKEGFHSVQLHFERRISLHPTPFWKKNFTPSNSVLKEEFSSIILIVWLFSNLPFHSSHLWSIQPSLWMIHSVNQVSVNTRIKWVWIQESSECEYKNRVSVWIKHILSSRHVNINIFVSNRLSSTPCFIPLLFLSFSLISLFFSLTSLLSLSFLLKVVSRIKSGFDFTLNQFLIR